MANQESSKMINMSIWQSDNEMSVWMAQNYCRLFSTNEGINFLFGILESYFKFLENKVKNSSKSCVSRIKIGKVNVNNIKLNKIIKMVTEIVDELLFEKVFGVDNETNIVELEIYLAICRYFESNKDIKHIGYYIVNLLFDDVKIITKNIEIKEKREMKLFFMQNLISASLSYKSPILLENIAYVLLDSQWYDKVEKSGGRFSEISPLSLIIDMFYETCTTLPVGIQIYKDLPKNCPKFSFLTLYSITYSYIERILKNNIQELIIEIDDKYLNVKYFALESLPLCFITIIKYWLENYNKEIMKLKISPFITLVPMHNVFNLANSVFKCFPFTSTYFNLILLSIILPLWENYSTFNLFASAIQFELVDYTYHMDFKITDEYFDYRNKLFSNIFKIEENSNLIENYQNIDNLNLLKTNNFENQIENDEINTELEEGEISIDMESCEEEDQNIECHDSNSQDIEMKSLFEFSEEELNTLEIFHGDGVNCDYNFDFQKWIQIIDILIKLTLKFNSNPYFPICIENFVQLFKTFLYSKHCLKDKDIIIEKLKNLKRGLSFKVDTIDSIISRLLNY